MPPSPIAVVASRALRMPNAKWPWPMAASSSRSVCWTSTLTGMPADSISISAAFSGASIAVGRNADQVIRELRQVVGRQRVLVIALEERIVVGLDIAAARFQLRDGDRLHDLDQLRQTRAMRLDRRRAVAEVELVGCFRAFALGVGVEGLAAQHRQRPLDSLAPLRRQFVDRHVARHQTRHRREVEDVRVQVAETGLQCGRLLARLRMDVRGTQDVRQPAYHVDRQACGTASPFRRARFARRASGSVPRGRLSQSSTSPSTFSDSTARVRISRTVSSRPAALVGRERPQFGQRAGGTGRRSARGSRARGAAAACAARSPSMPRGAISVISSPTTDDSDCT